MFRSATFKLTLWYLAIVMAISLIFSVVVYQVAIGELDRGLHRETQRIYNQFPVFQGNPLLRPGADYDNGAHRILLRLVGLNIIVLVGAGWASYLLARRTLEPIEEAHEQQKRFTADVSHELRTPLTALKMETEVALMNDKNGKKELRDTLVSNLEEAAKLENLINSLLRLTRLEANELEQHFSAVKISELLENAAAQVRKIADGKKITLGIKPPTQDATVSGDRDSLEQLLVILLDNAIKYSPAGSSVTMSGQTVNGGAELVVTDQGRGMSKKTLEHVFDRFYRGDDTSRSRNGQEGFGLGLSIAKMIADLHHGTVTITSRQEQGTTAIVSLPLIQP